MARFAIENTFLQVYWADLQGRLVEVNRAACESLGYAKSEILGLHVRDIDPSATDAVWQQMLDTLRTQSRAQIETRHRRRDGTEYPVQVHVTLFAFEGTDLVCGFAEDTSSRSETERALQASHARYRSVIETAQDGFWVTDLDARLLEVNDAYCRMSGFSREQLLSMHIFDLDAAESAEETLRHVQRVIDEGGAQFETRHRRRDGSYLPVEVSVSYSPVEGGRFFVFLRDIRGRKLEDDLLQLRQELGDIVYDGDVDGLMQRALDVAETLTGSSIGFFHFVERDQQNLSLQTWSTRTLREMCFAEGQGMHYPVDEAGVWVDCIHRGEPVIHNDYVALPHKKGMPEGHPQLVRELTVPVFREGLIVAVMGVGNKPSDYLDYDIGIMTRVADMAFDFVERARAEKRIEYMAYFDTLTGLPNRDLLADRMGQAMAQHRRNKLQLGVCYLDLDGFKPVNDDYGHDVGDALLVALAERLGGLMREGDTLARLSGDEFALLLTELSGSRDGEVIAGRILEAIAQPFELSGIVVNVSASIGMTLYPIDEASAHGLLRHADQAMYNAKSAGEGRFHLYDAVRDRKLRARRALLGEMDRALAADELVLHYQPRVELRSGRLVGVEALVRWQHPTRGQLPPGAFLPDLEGQPQEIALGRWVMRAAIDQHVAWRSQGLDVPVSINISPKHLQSQDFVAFLDGLLDAHSADTADRIELEILETSAIGDTERIADVMRDCTRLGVHFSLDDFGTGYSSLTHFHRLPVEILKIDQNFVRSMIDDVNDLDIVEGVLKLAEATGRPVVAEGVETPELAFLLLRLGCDYAQGYGISRPMPAEGLVTWLEAWRVNARWQRLPALVDAATGDVALDVAVYSHRQFIEHLVERLRAGDLAGFTLPGEDRCVFNQWYTGLGRARFGADPDYPFTLARHNLILDRAAELVGRVADGKGAIPGRELAEFVQQSEAFITELQKLAESG